jgi:hypothetical protein
LVLGHTDFLEVANKRFKLAEDADRAALCGQDEEMAGAGAEVE